MKSHVALFLVVLCALHTQVFAQNTPPAAPLITEPAFDGRVLNAEDVHMETAPFSDADAGQTHLCTDWEIWELVPSRRAWAAACATGLERLHVHLGDGAFENAHAGRTSLFPDGNYQLRVRHRDDSGVPATEWSAWSVRQFFTGPASSVFALELADVADTPTPRLQDEDGVAVELNAGVVPASVRVESPTGSLLLELLGSSGPGDLVSNPPELPQHVPLLLHVNAGGGPQNLILPDFELRFTDEDAVDRALYLPALNLAPAQSARFWISSNGSSYVAQAGQSQPDFSTLARGAATPWRVLQPGFRVEVLARGLQLPVNIAFVPNPAAGPLAPLFYVAELYGNIKVVRRDGSVGTYASGLLNFNPTGNFPGSGEQGLTGIVVDPFSGDVLAALLYDAAPPDGPHYPRVLRLQSTNGGQSATSQSIVLDMPGETQGQSHQISNLSIGPDAKLYVHMGDGFNVSSAQDLNSFRGKILRMNLDGSPASDNPFFSTIDGINARDYVYVYGVRNPFGGAWQSITAALHFVENGPSVDRMARASPGRNYLWDGSDSSMFNFALYNWTPAAAPVNIAFVQAELLAGSGFPAGLLGCAFVSESGATWASGPQARGKRIRYFTFDANGALASGPHPLIEYDGSGKATCAGLASGPDGLYFTDLYKDQNYISPIDPGANVLRVRYVGQVDFSADRTGGAGPLTVQFTSNANVPGMPSAWQWDFGDGSSSTLANPAHTYTQNGAYNVRLAVTGAAGVVSTQKNSYIRVGLPPQVAFIADTQPPSGADAQFVNDLTARGYAVSTYPDEPHARPTAASIASGADVIVISSSVASANIGGEFRNIAAPLVFWEQALLRLGREPLCTDGYVSFGETQIQIVDATHPITLGLPATLLVYHSPGALSLGRSTVAGDVRVLATRVSAPGEPAILVAQPGDILADGLPAAGKRVFLFLEDASWSLTTNAAQELVERAIAWARAPSVCAGDLTGDALVDESDLGQMLANWQLGAGGDLDGDGDTDESDLGTLLANWLRTCR